MTTGLLPETSNAVLSVHDLHIEFPGARGTVTAVRSLGFALAPGQALGVVGESGSGKSAAALALLGLHRGTTARVSGSILLHPRTVTSGPGSAGAGPSGPVDVNTADPAALRRLRGRELAMIFQEPLTSLDPYHRIGTQIAAVHRLHFGSSRQESRRRAIDALDQVGIDGLARHRAYPHEFSGGMRQRALIAMAMVLEPRVLVADEPTTALDVTVQAQILDLLGRLRRETGLSLVLISHDLAVVSGSVDDVVVLREGDAVERGPVRRVLTRPEHPYTRALLAAVPRLDTALPDDPADDPAEAPAGTAPHRERPAAVPAPRNTVSPLLQVRDLTVRFAARNGSAPTVAIDGVELDVVAGESLGIVGESGSGKTTLGRALVGLQRPTHGGIDFEGRDLHAGRGRILRENRSDLQLVFQDPASSLNPRRTVGDSVAEPLRVRGERDRAQLRAQVERLLDRVGLAPGLYDRFPHQLSGGQRQRAAIARALILRPRLVVCDEPVSALDVTTQAQVIGLLRELRTEFGLTLVFIAHDLAVVRQVSDRIAVMRRGRIVEVLPADRLADAQHEYTRALLAAVPVLPAADPVPHTDS